MSKYEELVNKLSWITQAKSQNILRNFRIQPVSLKAAFSVDIGILLEYY
jgi:hypothetical protein